ncbi:SMP-30/gluconolactonase/LRE family protein [Agromyces larvae]|uniref:SMP-30/gluconolactonase/LRE family protein n=1 Tax=Agromyces larvae TaxID=2929802 RepID=A0ABY4BXK2_9MICO|nr:SMP-30/gluconolactonase/LRE family protein [Agromyces larvae]UOE43484.1 SMP-30/gluconolactonase/LRE family protein [Agromyces larvae]
MPDRGDEVRPANRERCVLGEGPVWDAARERLLWVDIRRALVLVGALRDDGTVEVVERVGLPEAGTVGAIAVAESGEWLIAGAEGVLVRGVDGSVASGPRLLPAGSGRRLNDGAPDPAGRFVVGSMSLAEDTTDEVLVRVEHDGSVTTLDADLSLSNGLAWTADGRRMYSVDTLLRTVFVRDYDPQPGATGPREPFLRLDAMHPDGCCLDEEEHLWIARWDHGEVQRYSPAGDLVRSIPLPVAHATSVAFAGPDLATLVVTTASDGLSEAQLAASPASGLLFTLRPGVRGLPVASWAGSTGWPATHERDG